MVETGDTVTLKKKHPCGSDRFTVVRTGADYKLRCLGCGSTILLDHDAMKKRMRRREPAANLQTSDCSVGEASIVEKE